MRKTISTFLITALLLCMALATVTAGAAADSILPVLKTPKPEIVEAPAFHALPGRKAPEAQKTESGALRYTYADVGYGEYLDFGRLLAQEGFTLTDSGERAGNPGGAGRGATGASPGKRPLRRLIPPEKTALPFDMLPS